MRHIFQQISQRAPWKENRGSALLELALVLPIFVLAIVGSAEFGRFEYYSIEATNAARAGAAYAAQGTAFAATSNLSAIQTAAKNDAPDLTSVATMTVTSSTACQCDTSGVFTPTGTTESATTAASTCTSPGKIISYVQVNTSAPLSTILSWPGFPSSITLQGQAVMRIK